jgi:D-psicose/D-tagatose/L-ribulose 3-epimerase
VKKVSYTFPLSIQITLPEKYRDDEQFREVLRALQSLSFSGVELNIVRPERIVPDDLKDYLNGYGLPMTMFATGATAKALQLSLSSTDEPVRRRSVEKCLEFIEFARLFGAGVIVGFLKGGPAPDREQRRQSFRASLLEVAPRALEMKVPLLVEATNRYESAVANSLDDTCDLISPFADNPLVRILPDTFHMNIEERDQFGSLSKHRALYDSIHISDNNRFFPGFGAIRFAELFSFLAKTGYSGGLAIEGNIKKDLLSDIRRTVEFLEPLLRVT